MTFALLCGVLWVVRNRHDRAILACHSDSNLDAYMQGSSVTPDPSEARAHTLCVMQVEQDSDMGIFRRPIMFSTAFLYTLK